MLCFGRGYGARNSCACSSIDDTDPQTATTTSESVTDTPATDVTSQTDTPAETQPIAEPENWSYDFGWEFISENGLQYIWDRLDEDTRMNLGEVMNAIRDVQMYCPLTVGVPRDEAEKFWNSSPTARCFTPTPATLSAFTPMRTA